MNHQWQILQQGSQITSEWSFPSTLTMPYAHRCVQSRGCVDIPTDDILKEWNQQGIVQQRHRNSILVQPSKEHLETRMTLPFSTRISSISTRQTTTDSRSLKNPVERAVTAVWLRQKMHAFLVDIGAYKQPRSLEDREKRLDLDLSRTNKDN